MTASDNPLVRAALAAFPVNNRTLANGAAEMLAPLIRDMHLQRSIEAVVLGNPVRIPPRIYFFDSDTDVEESEQTLWLAAQCLYTRSNDGYVRQAALRRILTTDEPWVIPFIVLLAGEYVVEIIIDIVAAIPSLDHVAYANFVRENRPLMTLQRARATSYWSCYHSWDYPDRRYYPGLAFLHQLELWASETLI